MAQSIAALGIPPSSSTVRISIIDTTMRSRIPLSFFAGPPIPGLDTLKAPAYSFLITHHDSAGVERKLVFDLGLPVDLEKDFPPAVFEQVKAMKGSEGLMESKKYISDVLKEEGVALEGIEGVVWSHAHLDHVGKPSLFPSSTALIVGPGVKESYFPGYPEVELSPVLAESFQGREVIELSPTQFATEIGGLKALDYFGDGSFYFLLAPGHALGHINALARTTEGTFIYMAADSFHHTSQLRPHEGAVLPESNASCERLAAEQLQSVHPVSRPESLPERYHAAFSLSDAGKSFREVAFQSIVEAEDGTSIAVDVQAARDTIAAVQRFDACEDVFVVAAHDASLFDVLEYLPKEANEWKEKGWKEAGKWSFLEDLKEAVEGSG